MTATGGTSRLADEPAFALGGLTVRPATREIAGDGEVELLEPRVMQVLVTMARRRGQVVSRAELIDACWGGVAVGDDAVNRCIQALRRLGEMRGGFSILTVRGVGFRLDEAAAPDAPRTTAETARSATVPAARALGEERRHVTVLSCGLTRDPGAASDPEAWYAVSRAWRRRASEAALGLGGQVERARGERLVAYFGYPDGQEDAAERAVRAGLAIAELRSDGATVRVGIHAGLVVVGRDDAGEAEIFGDAPDLASRAQDVAPAGATLITGPVYDVVSGLVTAQPLPPLRPHDAGAGVRLYRAVAAVPAMPARGRGFSPREPSPFVGREDEAGLLKSRWAQVLEGRGQLVLVVGEPGIGKTRLVEAFQAVLRDEAPRAIACAGAPLFAATPFHAVRQILEQSLGRKPGDTPAARVARLEAAVAAAGLRAADAVPLIADLLDLPLPSGHAPPTPASDERRRRLLAVLADWVFALAAEHPLLLAVEDLHWVDPSSLELFQVLAEQGATAPLMLLATARPEFAAAWPARSHHTRITLAGLPSRPMRALVEGLVRRAGLSDDVAAVVVERADGVPLFAEELTRLMLDGEGNRAPGPLGAGHIPATLRDSLAARLDGMRVGKDVAQQASVLGRTFSHDLLRIVSGLPDADLTAGLARLAEAELIYVRGMAPEATYQFKHALIQDAAYATLLQADRRHLHARTAQALCARDGAPDAQPEVLARHWTEAGEDDKAIAAWTRAAEAAVARHAFVEAETHYGRALDILATKPHSPARDQHELDLGLALIVVLTATHGHVAPTTAERAARNHQLAEGGGFVGAMTGMRSLAFSHAVISADWAKATVQAEQMRAFAEGLGPRAEPKGRRFAVAMSHFAPFQVAYYCGRLAEAEGHFERWLACHEGEEFDQRLTTTPALCNAALLACHQGRADVARQRSDRAMAWAANTGVAYEMAFAAALKALLQVSLGEDDDAERLGTAAAATADELGVQHIAGWARVAIGCARARRGAAREGVTLIKAAIDDFVAVNYRVSLPLFMNLLAEAQARKGAIDDALATLSDALIVSPQERTERSHSLILRGELRARTGQEAAAMADFDDAIREARSTGARAHELRAATGLARRLAARGEAAAGFARLQPLLEQVVAGGESRDVRDARHVIAALTT